MPVSSGSVTLPFLPFTPPFLLISHIPGLLPTTLPQKLCLAFDWPKLFSHVFVDNQLVAPRKGRVTSVADLMLLRWPQPPLSLHMLFWSLCLSSGQAVNLLVTNRRGRSDVRTFRGQIAERHAASSFLARTLALEAFSAHGSCSLAVLRLSTCEEAQTLRERRPKMKWRERKV